MPHDLKGKKVAFLAADAFEESELLEPWNALEQAGAELTLVSLEEGEITALNEQELKPGVTRRVDLPVEQAEAGDFDALVLAGVVSDRTLTSYPSIQTDIRNAGGNWVDEEVHVDNGLVTSRKPDDLPAFVDKLIEEIAEGRHAGQV